MRCYERISIASRRFCRVVGQVVGHSHGTSVCPYAVRSSVMFGYLISRWVSCSAIAKLLVPLTNVFQQEVHLYDKHLNERHSVTLGKHLNQFFFGRGRTPPGELMTLPTPPSQLGEPPFPTHAGSTPRSGAEHVSGTENGAERSENQVERSGAWSGRGRNRWSGSGARSGRSRSGNEAGRGLNRPLTARSNLTFNWFRNVYSPHSTVYSFSLHSFTLHAPALSLVPTRPNLLPITQPKAFLS